MNIIDEIIPFLEHVGAANLNQRPGLSRFEVDADWSITVNPHGETIDGQPAFTFQVDRAGKAVALLSPSGMAMILTDLSGLVTALRAARGVA